MCVCVCARSHWDLARHTHKLDCLTDPFFSSLLFEMTSRWTGGGVLGDEGEGMEKRGREE